MEKNDLKLDINTKFDKKIKELEENLPIANPIEGGCAEITLISILDILGIHNEMFNNLMIPLSGGLGGYTSKNGWSGPCGVVCGACAAVGAIIGGKEKMSVDLVPVAFVKGAQVANGFEQEFGSVVCPEICGFDFSEPNAFVEYVKKKVWAKICYKLVIWAVNYVREITQEELENW